MPKKTKLPARPAKSWEEIDQHLRRLGEIQVSLTDLQGRMTLEINEVKERFDGHAEALRKEKDLLEQAIAGFAEENKAEFVSGRTRELTFGSLAYRVTKSIRVISVAGCILGLKALNLHDYIRTKEEPNKEALAGLDDNTLVKVCAKRVVEDKLTIEPNIEKIRDCA